MEEHLDPEPAGNDSGSGPVTGGPGSRPAEADFGDESDAPGAVSDAVLDASLAPATAPGEGYIVLAATPIGNMGDASARLVSWLGHADIVAAEDTRRLHRLVTSLGVTVSGRIVSYHEHNEAAKTPELLAQVQSGKVLLMVTDAGMPSVSDPGYRLVEAAVAAGIRVTVAPGPSAVLTALALSGLPTDRFCFEGFLPRKSGERATRLHELALEPRTMVFFEAPHRLEAMLRALHTAFGPSRQGAVCRELTKTYEEVIRKPLSGLLEWAEAAEIRGEIAIVVAGAPAADPGTPEDHVAAVNELMGQGMRMKEAVAVIAHDVHVSKRELYSAVLAARG
ncbi:16S rRNA (cytidine(1402)-2'-O)-methyltransferase [Arthrobacter sp. SDTb3-6]|uniref:16S rRNA (cytidine(1402)-2'-O)-methyltransferase n=1 Tax=Arthrobacter sp. SDTb3-6 TaxID=2713571 RepID=UPI00159CF9D0|nr:16S rRNA (cytidine(1402)-2'-O)-methyltransferase [Arthrobacter sp. SDTb3-6]NVM99284.1 16S rRNA (cytidine(1402)-2'-O)-methyltransferase [Arthrobacter sp. SDTb3-6]